MYEKKAKAPPERSLLADFFDKAHVVETFRVAFKNGARQRRLRVIMLIIVVMVVDGPLHGKWMSRRRVCGVYVNLFEFSCVERAHIEQSKHEMISTLAVKCLDHFKYVFL